MLKNDTNRLRFAIDMTETLSGRANISFGDAFALVAGKIATGAYRDLPPGEAMIEAMLAATPEILQHRLVQPRATHP